MWAASPAVGSEGGGSKKSNVARDGPPAGAARRLLHGARRASRAEEIGGRRKARRLLMSTSRATTSWCRLCRGTCYLPPTARAKRRRRERRRAEVVPDLEELGLAGHSFAGAQQTCLLWRIESLHLLYGRLSHRCIRSRASGITDRDPAAI